MPLKSWSEFEPGEQTLANPELDTSLIHDDSLLDPSMDFSSAPCSIQRAYAGIFPLQTQKADNTLVPQCSGATNFAAKKLAGILLQGLSSAQVQSPLQTQESHQQD